MLSTPLELGTLLTTFSHPLQSARHRAPTLAAAVSCSPSVLYESLSSSSATLRTGRRAEAPVPARCSRQGAFRRTGADINLGGGGGESVSEVLKSTRKVEIDELVHISLVR